MRKVSYRYTTNDFASTLFRIAYISGSLIPKLSFEKA